MANATDQQSNWLSISAAAKLLGVSRQAIQNRIKRGTLETRRNNRGEMVVQCPATPPATLQTAVARQTVTATIAPISDSEPAEVSNETVPIGRHLAELERLEKLFREAADRTDRQHKEAIEFWRERSDSAECRAEQATQALADLVSRILALVPAGGGGGSEFEKAGAGGWLSRLFGTSKKSDI